MDYTEYKISKAPKIYQYEKYARPYLFLVFYALSCLNGYGDE